MGAWELLPSLFLLAMGGFISIRSGVPRLATFRDLRIAFDNLSHILVRILAYGAAMLLVQEWIGMHPGLGW